MFGLHTDGSTWVLQVISTQRYHVGDIQELRCAASFWEYYIGFPGMRLDNFIRDLEIWLWKFFHSSTDLAIIIHLFRNDGARTRRARSAKTKQLGSGAHRLRPDCTFTTASYICCTSIGDSCFFGLLPALSQHPNTGMPRYSLLYRGDSKAVSSTVCQTWPRVYPYARLLRYPGYNNSCYETRLV